jgi:chorismate-pyruvate lyase
MLYAPVLDPAPPALAAIFASDRPLTLLLEDAAGRAAGHPAEVTVKITHRQDRILRSVQAGKLDAAEGTPGHYRTGQLRAGEDILAYTDAVIRLDLLPGIPPAEFAGDTPLGKILLYCGVRRETVSAEIMHAGRIRLKARMLIEDQIVAAVSELLTPHAVALLART